MDWEVFKWWFLPVFLYTNVGFFLLVFLPLLLVVSLSPWIALSLRSLSHLPVGFTGGDTSPVFSLSLCLTRIFLNPWDTWLKKKPFSVFTATDGWQGEVYWFKTWQFFASFSRGYLVFFPGESSVLRCWKLDFINFFSICRRRLSVIVYCLSWWAFVSIMTIFSVFAFAIVKGCSFTGKSTSALLITPFPRVFLSTEADNQNRMGVGISLDAARVESSSPRVL